MDYTVLTALGGHAIPLTQRMIEYLYEMSWYYPNADRADIEGFFDSPDKRSECL